MSPTPKISLKTCWARTWPSFPFWDHASFQPVSCWFEEAEGFVSCWHQEAMYKPPSPSCNKPPQSCQSLLKKPTPTSLSQPTKTPQRWKHENDTCRHERKSCFASNPCEKKVFLKMQFVISRRNEILVEVCLYKLFPKVSTGLLGICNKNHAAMLAVFLSIPEDDRSLPPLTVHF